MKFRVLRQTRQRVQIINNHRLSFCHISGIGHSQADTRGPAFSGTGWECFCAWPFGIIWFTFRPGGLATTASGYFDNGQLSNDQGCNTVENKTRRVYLLCFSRISSTSLSLNMQHLKMCCNNNDDCLVQQFVRYCFYFRGKNIRKLVFIGHHFDRRFKHCATSHTVYRGSCVGATVVGTPCCRSTTIADSCYGNVSLL